MGTPESSLLAVLTTVANRDDARRLARQMVRAGLAACAQLEPIESIYVWKGELVEEPEIRITFKTTRQHRQALMELLREVHPYEIPAIMATPL
jgi:periplasmic divalent cation tolerance protein